MAETRSGNGKWLWHAISNDLDKQGGLKGVIIDPTTVRPNKCKGTSGDVHFHISWLHDHFLLLTMSDFSPELVNAFAKVLEYEPFCKYMESGVWTVEWDKIDPTERYDELLEIGGAISNLTQLVK